MALVNQTLWINQDSNSLAMHFIPFSAVETSSNQRQTHTYSRSSPQQADVIISRQQSPGTYKKLAKWAPGHRLPLLTDARRDIQMRAVENGRNISSQRSTLR